MHLQCACINSSLKCPTSDYDEGLAKFFVRMFAYRSAKSAPEKGEHGFAHEHKITKPFPIHFRKLIDSVEHVNVHVEQFAMYSYSPSLRKIIRATFTKLLQTTILSEVALYSNNGVLFSVNFWR